MDAMSMIADWKRRLIAVAENPAYLFRDTPLHLIEQHHRRLTTFVGYTEAEVAAAEQRLGVRFTMVFRTFLLEMAKSAGNLFCGSDLARIDEFERFRAEALGLMAETNPELDLPPSAVVFLSHQGYTFLYVTANGEFDGPPMQWVESEGPPREAAPTFGDLVDAELRLMERNSRGFHESGGYYLTLHPDGGASEEFPALSSGERPLAKAAGKKDQNR
jgi:hypothetical protein